MPRIAIIGAGYIGRLVARRHLAQHDSVVGLSRGRETLHRFAATGADTAQIDLDKDDLTEPGCFSGIRLYYFAPPPAKGTEDSRLKHFLESLGDNKPEKFLLISTTGVYGDCNGEWVDETRAPNPRQDRAKRRLNAEQQLETWCASRDIPHVILRVPGIYGAERLPFERLKQQTPILAAQDCPFTNRIHAHDLAALCQLSMENAQVQGIFNVSDNEPSTLYDYFLAVARTFGLQPPPVISREEASDKLSPGILSYLGESRRIDNRKLLKLLHYDLQYPTLREGLIQCQSELESA